MALQSTGQGADQIQSGPESQRPSITSPGQVRFNTNTQDFELYDGGRWVPMRPPVENPVRDNNRTIGLNYNRGLTLSGANLEAHLANGLDFNGDGAIRVVADGDISLAYEPLIASNTTAMGPEEVRGGPIKKDLPGSKLISCTPPSESNAALAIAAVKIGFRGNSNSGAYVPNEVNGSYFRGTFEAALGGRNCYAYTAGVQHRMGADFGGSFAYEAGSSGQISRDASWDTWILKIEELRWDKNKTEPITFNFTWPYFTMTTGMLYYGGVRMAVMPYQISS